ncbi:hypothetical protein BC629DRAFT_1589040 [Irpex lacteus]|nr:hypothetical protein BC629DRAFT_1589040 [Irpex lacteus]
MYFSLASVLLAAFFFFELASAASIRVRSPYCCKNKLQTRSLSANSPLRRQTASSSVSYSWVGTDCTLYPPEWVDPSFECDANVMYCTNTLQGSFGGTAVNCVPVD